MAPAASIVIPNWNGEQYLSPCLDALDRQTLGHLGSGVFETIVVDNGSSDHSLEVLRERDGIRVLALPFNLGFAGGVNAGIRAARAPVIVLLNNDTQAEPGWLESLLAALEANPKAGMATSKVLTLPDRDRLHTTGDLMAINGFASNRGAWEIDEGQWDEARSAFGACAAAGAYRRAVFDDVGLFEEAFGSYMEDVDLAFRAQLAGWTCVYAPRARIFHHVSATGGGTYASFHVARNRIWMIVRNFPAELLIQAMPQILSAQLGAGLSALRAWRGAEARATLRGQLAGLLGIPLMLRHRKRIQSRRKIDHGLLVQRMEAGRFQRKAVAGTGEGDSTHSPE